ncbi:MAG: hypothetical protein JKY43_08795 [Phycisphaerales bacterium]|nr:hypothetical protein [Phycisphaerales bacterium]
MTKSPLNNPPQLVCIHCQYERALDDDINICPECGQHGLAYAYQLLPRLRKIRMYVWAEIIMVLFLTASVTGTIIGNLPLPTGLFLIVFLAASIQGFVGIVIICGIAERGGRHTNSTLRKYSLIGMTLSILLLLSLPILIFIVITL